MTINTPVPAQTSLVVGVVADTHVPDRAVGLHPGLLPGLRAAGVELILHAGDICTPAVIEALRQVAPVRAVRGNRDWAFRGQFPWTERLVLANVPVLLMHGHGGWRHYLLDKWKYMLSGYRLERYLALAKETAPDAKVYIFGHTHRAENRWSEGQLLFNPGSACFGIDGGRCPTFGVLQFTEQGVQGEIIRLEGKRLIKGDWVECN